MGTTQNSPSKMESHHNLPSYACMLLSSLLLLLIIITLKFIFFLSFFLMKYLTVGGLWKLPIPLFNRQSFLLLQILLCMVKIWFVTV
jgi:hypothetical protein